MPQNLIERLKQSPVLCDGAMGTLLYAKGIFINRSYDELNLSQPELIRAVHHDYLQAGAEIVETNTFGANSFRLARHSIADRVRDINIAGAHIAREAAKSFDVWVAGSIGLVNIVHNLNRGLDLGGNPIGRGTGFVIGVGANPGLPNLDEEIRRFEYKVEAGAEYVVTQPVFDLSLLEAFLKRIEHCRIPLVAGIWPLVSARNAEFMKNELRVSVPDEILNRMAKATTPEAAREEGVAIAREMLSAVRDRVQGAQISAPQGRYSSAVDVLEALGTKPRISI